MRALVAFHSDYGHAEAVAKAIAAGMRGAVPELAVRLARCEALAPEDLAEADALVIGGPVHMGGMAWPVRRLLDATSALWSRDAMEGKLGAAFATFGGLGGAGGGVELALVSIWAVFAELGMLCVGFPKSYAEFAHGGLHWGLAVRTADEAGAPVPVNDAQLAAARAFGAHIAETMQRIFAREG